MTIETKYNIGDEVWVIMDNKAQWLEIMGVRIERCTIEIKGDILPFDKMHIYYYFDQIGYATEDRCFPTKEELLKSL